MKSVSNKININGYVNDEDIANEIAVHFEKVFNSSDNEVAYNEYLHKRVECMINDDLQSSYECYDKVCLEQIDKCLQKMKLGKACGPDDLSVEHLLHAHPSLIMHLQALFKLIILHGHVPTSFGIGVTIPLVKDKTGNFNDVNNYRGITLSPVISKLFEIVLLEICDDVLHTDSLQFGFKEKVGSVDAIFTLRSTIEYFINRGNSVSMASLDIRKAFDRVNHYKLYKSRLD